MSFSTHRFLLLAALVSLFAVGVFLPGLGGGFMLDDSHVILENPMVQVPVLSLGSLLEAATSFFAGGSLRPLAMMSFEFDYWRLGGLDPAGFKATNLFIHAVTAFVLAIFIRRLLLLARWPQQRAALAALALALLWATHPLQVSSVLYVVQRMQTLATFFLLLALWSYLRLRQAEIEGRSGAVFGVMAMVWWVFALASKEDAALLPAYTLVLELTILGFQAAEPERARSLRRVYLLSVAAGLALFIFWVVPHYWSSQPYPGRDFNSIEGLLTQGRVLVMYLGQIFFPFPQFMPFNYDHLEVSRSLLSPVSTIPALVVLVALLVWAWCWRKRRPVFSCGVLLFFAGHFMTSNVIGLEMAFEHRNHFPLIGALLAVVDLCVLAVQRWGEKFRWAMVVAAIALAGVAAAGAVRAYAWGDSLRFARYSVEIAPESPRAWLNLGGTYFDLAGRHKGRGSPYLTQAIETAEVAAARTDSPSAYSNIVIYKTVQGAVTDADWSRLIQRLEDAPMLPPTKHILWLTMRNVRADIGLDEAQVMRLIEVFYRRAAFSGEEYLRIGVFVYRHMPQNRELALSYFVRAAEALPADDDNIVRLKSDLSAQGYGDWAAVIDQARTTVRGNGGG